MTIIQKLRARTAIRKVAKQQGISTSQCREEISEAIREAWETSDPVIRQCQLDLVGEGRVPTPEEFIYLISSKLSKDFT